MKSPAGMAGTGRGNIHDRDAVTAFTFTSFCEGSLALTSEKTSDAGRWLVKEERLQVAGQGDDGSPQRVCVLQTKLLPKVVYLKDFSTGGITELSQEDFKVLREKKRGELPAAPQ